MRYIPSRDVKGKDVMYDGILDRTPWVIADGTLDFITEKYNLKERKDIEDIGCGNGSTLQYFAETANTLTGTDLNNYLTVPSKDRIKFSIIDMNFEPLPYEDGSKDLVFALQVVEHLENPFYIMREAHRVLKEDGLFIFSVPNPYTFATKLRFLFTDNMRRWHLGNDHLLFLTKDVTQKTYGANFVIESAHYQRGLVPFIGRLYKLFGIKATEKNTKIFPRIKMFGDSVCYVLRKK